MRFKRYTKNLILMESYWTTDIENRLSISPLFELVSKVNGSRVIKLMSGTIEEFIFNIDLIKNKRGFKILFLGFHGVKGKIILPNLKLDLETLAKIMGKGFRNDAIILSSCKVLDIERERVNDFISATDVMMVIGYKKAVNFMQSLALDLLVLDSLNHYKNGSSFWDNFRRSYKDLVSITGLEVYQK
jgi:hypothetical protein